MQVHEIQEHGKVMSEIVSSLTEISSNLKEVLLFMALIILRENAFSKIFINIKNSSCNLSTRRKVRVLATGYWLLQSYSSLSHHIALPILAQYVDTHDLSDYHRLQKTSDSLIGSPIGVLRRNLKIVKKYKKNR